MPRAVIAGHDQEYASSHLQGGPRRNDGGGIPIAKGRLDGRNHPIGIELLAHILFGENLHGRIRIAQLSTHQHGPWQHDQVRYFAPPPSTVSSIMNREYHKGYS